MNQSDIRGLAKLLPEPTLKFFVTSIAFYLRES